MSRKVGWLVLACSLGLLAGCAGAGGVRDGSGDTPAEEHSIAPERAGKLQMGMSVNQVYDLYEDRTRLVDLWLEGEFAPALEIRTGKDKSHLVIASLSDGWTVCGIEVKDPRFRTAHGIGVGSSLGDVRRHFSISSVGWDEGELNAISRQGKMTFKLDGRECMEIMVEDDRHSYPDTTRVSSVFLWPVHDNESYIIHDRIADQLLASASPEYYGEHYDELLYMVRKGNHKTQRAVAKVLPGALRSRCGCSVGDGADGDAVIAIALYMSYEGLGFLDELSTGDTETVLRFLAELGPVDFSDRLEEYLKQRPDIKRAAISGPERQAQGDAE